MKGYLGAKFTTTDVEGHDSRLVSKLVAVLTSVNGGSSESQLGALVKNTMTGSQWLVLPQLISSMVLQKYTVVG